MLSGHYGARRFVTFPLGRLPRTRNPGVPHMSALMAGRTAPAVPVSVNWATGLPVDLGMLGNNTLGDCAEAGFGHARQLWTFHAEGSPAAVTTAETEQLYSAVTGYVPGQPGTDRGTVLQSLLAYLVTTGAPLQNGSREKLFAFVEIDPQRADHLNLATFEAGLVYIGFTVPAYLQSEFNPGTTWDVNPGADNAIVGGHCVISGGYRADGTREIISWGSTGYAMTPAFWNAHVDEAYALISRDWLERTGRTFAGYTLGQLEQQMQAVRQAA